MKKYEFKQGNKLAKEITSANRRRNKNPKQKRLMKKHMRIAAKAIIQKEKEEEYFL